MTRKMGLAHDHACQIAVLLRDKIRRKLTEYDPETTNMPLHTRLLGKDRMALFSFVQSINTTLGTSVFEQVAVILARPRFLRAEAQYKELNASISTGAQRVVQSIMDELTTGAAHPDKQSEIERVRAVARTGASRRVKKPRVDLFLVNHGGVEHYFDLKTAKPNMDEFKAHKRKLLEWVAYRLNANPDAQLKTALAIPYNPYEPEPYQRWTLAGLYDAREELLVAEEFWNFLGGEGAYSDLLDVFEKVGIEMRDEIDARFAEFR